MSPITKRWKLSQNALPPPFRKSLGFVLLLLKISPKYHPRFPLFGHPEGKYLGILVGWWWCVLDGDQRVIKSSSFNSQSISQCDGANKFRIMQNPLITSAKYNTCEGSVVCIKIRETDLRGRILHWDQGWKGEGLRRMEFCPCYVLGITENSPRPS